MTVRAPRLDRQQKEPTDLYFIESQCAERFVKIGIASNIRTRLCKMQMDCPYPLKLLKLVSGAANMERGLHLKFAGDNVTGEWFRPSTELHALIDSLEGRSTMEDPEVRLNWIPRKNRTPPADQPAM